MKEEEISRLAHGAIVRGAELYTDPDPRYGVGFWAFLVDIPELDLIVAVDEKLAKMSGNVQKFIEGEIKLMIRAEEMEDE